MQNALTHKLLTKGCSWIQDPPRSLTEEKKGCTQGFWVADFLAERMHVGPDRLRQAARSRSYEAGALSEEDHSGRGAERRSSRGSHGHVQHRRHVYRGNKHINTCKPASGLLDLVGPFDQTVLIGIWSYRVTA